MCVFGVLVRLRSATELWDDAFNIDFGTNVFKGLGNCLGHCPMWAEAARPDLAVEEVEEIKGLSTNILILGTHKATRGPRSNGQAT